MPKERTGSIRRRGEKIYAVVTFHDKHGKRKFKEKLVKNESEAHRQIRAMLNKIDNEGTDALTPKRKTFRELAERYKTEIAIPPVVRGGKTIRGLKSHKIVCNYVDYWIEIFGNLKLEKLSSSLVEEAKNSRLDEAVETQINVRVPNVPNDGSRRKWRIEKQTFSRPRAVASVNRELATLRRMLTLAKQWQWLNKSPFDEKSKTFITTGDEVQRDRILTRAEEIRLTRAVEMSESEFLKVCFYCAVDLGLRKGEMLKLTWQDIDLLEGTATIQANNSKTERKRTVFLSSRLIAALEGFRCEDGSDERVIGLTDFKRSWQTALRKAGIENFRWHDLRHHHGSMAVASGSPLSEVSAQLGHQSMRTTGRYINRNIESGRNYARLRDEHNSVIENEVAKLEVIEASGAIN